MRRCLLACALVALAGASYAPVRAEAAAGPGLWHPRAGAPAAGRHGLRPEVRPRRFRALDLRTAALQDALRAAPPERAAASLTVVLPRPGGGFERFAIRRSQIMTPALAAAHPGIRTYAGRGIDDPAATIHLDTGPAGLHASVRSPLGAWYIDPYNRGDTAVYAVYRGADLPNVHGRLAPRGGDVVSAPTAAPLLAPAPFAGRSPGGLVDLRTYRLALLTDP